MPERLKDYAISQIQERLENGDLDRIYVLFDRYIHTDESGNPKEFEMRAEAFLKRAMKKRGTTPGRGARIANERKRARKAAELEEACRKSGLSPEAYAKAKQTVKRLKGSNDWLPKLDPNDLSAFDAMMNDWRLSGLDYWTWQEEKEKERKAEAEKRRQEREAHKQETPEERAGRRREESAECMRRLRDSRAEESRIASLNPQTLRPADVPGASQDFSVKFVVLPKQTAEDPVRIPHICPSGHIFGPGRPTEVIDTAIDRALAQSEIVPYLDKASCPGSGEPDENTADTPAESAKISSGKG